MGYLVQDKQVGVLVRHDIPDTIAREDEKLVPCLPIEDCHVRLRRYLLLLIGQIRTVFELIVSQGSGWDQYVHGQASVCSRAGKGFE